MLKKSERIDFVFRQVIELRSTGTKKYYCFPTVSLKDKKSKCLYSHEQIFINKHTCPYYYSSVDVYEFSLDIVDIFYDDTNINEHVPIVR